MFYVGLTKLRGASPYELFLKHLVGVMGGEITVESEGHSRGATFLVRFRLHHGEHAARPARSLAADA